MDALERAMAGRPVVWDRPDRKRDYAKLEQAHEAVAAVSGWSGEAGH